ncbi:MAG TPA: GTP-binding protein [Candidatus Paceibacterota bacterium]|jgi:translation initiation factor IF-2|nr:GTP-binding protein [Candidatus Paceibacterota bacterium]
MATAMQPKTDNAGIKTAQKSRPPIVVVVGHVDHGKTTLLDYIRKTTVAAREAGGITQAVGAYEIEHGGRKITFIDTPGHEAFAAMRSRGAQAADLAILVVAADEGVKPQTKEAIKTLEDAKTPFIVAFNKVDKLSGGNFEKAKTELMSAGVLLEGYGGTVSYHAVSAKTGEGVDELLDLILLAADLENLTYDPAAPASGFILEVRRDPRRGIEATAIVKNGTLRRGDAIATPTAQGKVKILENFLEKTVPELAPSAPAVIIGFESLPAVGEEFAVGGASGEAGVLRQAALTRSAAASSAEKAAAAKTKTPITPGAAAAKKETTLNLILKASDSGSLEALSLVLKNVGIKAKDVSAGAAGTRAKSLNIIEESVGDITDGDVKHALATNATIIGFKNRVEKGALMLADAQGTTIITSKIVYDLAKVVEDFLTGAAGPQAAGELEVLAIFNQEKADKQLVGGRVVNGLFRGKSSFEILRHGPDGHEAPAGMGRVLGLREKKAEITQAEKGKEIGVLVNSQGMIQVGDKLVIRK